MHNTLISTAELASRLDDPRVAIFDVRHDLTKPDRWGEDRFLESHVPQAIFVHLDRDLSAPKTGRNGRHPLPSPAQCASLFSRLGVDSTKDVVAYDQGGGMFAARLWWMLRWLGHDTAAVLDGGFAKWTAEGRPVTAEPSVPRPASFAARRVGSTVNAFEVLQGLGTHKPLLVDARVPERFRGEIEPLDPVAGHIPGARNRPYGLNLNADGTFKPAEVLRAQFAELLGATAPEHVAHYCGSGVTACHNLLAMEVAGLGGTRLYPGSWSEWCADPTRPVATV